MYSKRLLNYALFLSLAISASFRADAADPANLVIGEWKAFGDGASPTPTPLPNPEQPLWVDAKLANGIAYFIFQGTAPHLERFDLQSDAWLPTVPLSGAPTALAVDGTGIYVSFGRRTARLALDGSGETHLTNTAANVGGLVIHGDYLYLFSTPQSGNLVSSILKTSGSLLDAKTFSNGMGGVCISPARNKIFGRSDSGIPTDIVQLTINANGTLGTQTDSPYHGEYPNAWRTYLFPDQSRVADNAGIIYSTTDLTYVNSFAGGFTDLDFSGDLPVVLRNHTLIGYSNTLLETGRYQLAGNPLRIFVAGDFIHSFYQGDTRGVFAVKTALSALVPGTPGDPVDPTNLVYTPDHVILGEDGVIYLLSRSNFSIFRWSGPERRYLPTIPLVDAPTFIAYSSVNHALYLAYPGGRINRILPTTSLDEVPFANLALTPKGLATAGEFVFACDGSGIWNTHYIIRPDGTVASTKDINEYSREYIWSAANRKMYFFRDDISPNDIIWENINPAGVLGTSQDSPYHDSTGFVHPIRVAPDGSVVVLGSGRVFNAIALTLTTTLPNPISDADWLNGSLFSVRASGTNTQLQVWNSNYAQSGSIQIAGIPMRLLAVGSKLLAITRFGGRPAFTELDSNLNILFQYLVTPPPHSELRNISTRGRVQTGDNVMIAGFIVTGSDPKTVLVRALGPTLTGFGVPDALQDPMLELHRPGASTISNDDWKQDQRAEIELTQLAPTFDSESAILVTLSPGAYTAIVRGKNGSSGAGLVEVYDLAPEVASNVVNVSTRMRVETGDNVMIGGLIVGGGSNSVPLLVRALGPSLTYYFGFEDALQDPVLSLHDGNGNVTFNDSWLETQQAEISATGLAPEDPREAAILVTLPPGLYTAIMSGQGGTSGVALLEAYRLP